MATSWPDTLPPLPPGSFLSHSGTNSGQEVGRSPGRLRGIWRVPCLQVPKGPSGPAHTPCESWACRPRLPVPGAAPAGGCALQPLPALAAPLLWRMPSGIFNWKLISSHLNKCPRQRRGTHPPAEPRPPTPTWDKERRESGYATL